MRCRWYESTETLAPDPDELESLIGDRTRALYLVHPLGFPLDASGWRHWCDQRGLLLIEDAAQSWLATRNGVPLGSVSDMSLTCIYKMLPVPDGAAVISRPAPDPPRTRSSLGLGGVLRGHGAWMGQHFGAIGAANTRLRRAREFDIDQYLELGNPNLGPSALSRALIPRLADERIRDRRRENYRVLLSRLEEFVPAPFGQLVDGACPWLFPVATPAKAKMLTELRRHGISAMNFWSVSHPLLPESEYSKTAERRRTTVGLPVHQELRPEHLERISSVSLRFLRRS